MHKLVSVQRGEGRLLRLHKQLQYVLVALLCVGKILHNTLM